MKPINKLNKSLFDCLQVKWLRLIYNDFSTFSTDQEHLISFNRRNDPNGADYVEGMLLLNKPPLILSFYPPSDQPRITSLVTQYGITYVLELVKYYDTNSQVNITEVLSNILWLLSFIVPLFFLFVNPKFLGENGL